MPSVVGIRFEKYGGLSASLRTILDAPPDIDMDDYRARSRVQVGVGRSAAAVQQRERREEHGGVVQREKLCSRGSSRSLAAGGRTQPGPIAVDKPAGGRRHRGLPPRVGPPPADAPPHRLPARRRGLLPRLHLLRHPGIQVRRGYRRGWAKGTGRQRVVSQVCRQPGWGPVQSKCSYIGRFRKVHPPDKESTALSLSAGQRVSA